MMAARISVFHEHRIVRLKQGPIDGILLQQRGDILHWTRFFLQDWHQ